MAVQGLSELWGLSGSPGECRGDLGVFGSPGKFGSPWESAINAVVSAWKRPWFITPGPFEGPYKTPLNGLVRPFTKPFMLLSTGRT